MNRRLILRPEGEADILDIALWYESREAGLGLEVTAEIRAAIERAVDGPFAYLLMREHPHVRRVLARRFPYRIFYIVRPAPSSCLRFSMPRAMRAIGEAGCERVCGPGKRREQRPIKAA